MNLSNGCGRNGGQIALIPSFPRGPVCLAGCLWGRWRQGELGSVPALSPVWSGAVLTVPSWESGKPRGPALRSRRSTGGYQPSAPDRNCADCSVCSIWFHPVLILSVPPQSRM